MSRPRSPDRPSSRERRGSEDLRVRWRVDHEKSVLLSNFERRSWPRSVEDGEWNFYWARYNIGRLPISRPPVDPSVTW